MAILLVATEPEKPKKHPVFISSTDTDITLSLDIDSIENNGSPISDYSLEMSDDLTVYSTVDTYTTNV